MYLSHWHRWCHVGFGGPLFRLAHLPTCLRFGGFILLFSWVWRATLPTPIHACNCLCLWGCCCPQRCLPMPLCNPRLTQAITSPGATPPGDYSWGHCGSRWSQSQSDSLDCLEWTCGGRLLGCDLHAVSLYILMACGHWISSAPATVLEFQGVCCCCSTRSYLVSLLSTAGNPSSFWNIHHAESNAQKVFTDLCRQHPEQSWLWAYFTAVFGTGAIAKELLRRDVLQDVYF